MSREPLLSEHISGLHIPRQIGNTDCEIVIQCSSQLTPVSMNTSSYSNGQGLIFMRTSSELLDCMLKGRQKFGVWLE